MQGLAKSSTTAEVLAGATQESLYPDSSGYDTAPNSSQKQINPLNYSTATIHPSKLEKVLITTDVQRLEQMQSQSFMKNNQQRSPIQGVL